DVTIIGGGASGMAAAVFAAEAGLKVRLFEKNEKLGKKLYITGKGRCNFTSACNPEEFLENVVSNRKFLYSAIYGFNSFDTIDFFERLGLRTKVERGRRAFPASDHSSDVIKALRKRIEELGVEVNLNTEVKELPVPDEEHAVIAATGGLSYPSTGSTGDGYAFAEKTGHRITETRPALVPFETKEDFIKELQGLSLRNVSFTLKNGRKTVYEGFGELVFTHFGISGPLVISASSYAAALLKDTALSAHIDLKPALTYEQLDDRILREFESGKNKCFRNILSGLLPSKMIPVMIEMTGIPSDRSVNSLTKEDRKRLAESLKDFSFTVTGTRDYNEAVITQGGISVKDIDPKTMESRLVKNLYFIGEVIDVDALTGGYNLQIAWSTAYAAVRSIAEKAWSADSQGS
ncbi:MAG: NAD(P)/FAD-dependent oxidoreductase, partial [Lachnospiraceae bacterium]|nr:NAD(P)/FAD-dependent oxidoreductase [Lachnospiraceae bacterium]